MRDWFSLLAGSPAAGAGPNGTDKGGVVPFGASISGEPNGTTSQTNATLTVGVNRAGASIPTGGWPDGSGYTHYKWRLDTGAWSAETPIDTPISLTGLPDGPHYVEVIGRNDAGFYQDDALFQEDAAVTRSRIWTVQTGTAPIITKQPVSQTVNTGADVTFSVVATSATQLFYQWRAGWVPGDIPGATNDTLVLTNVQPAIAGNYRVLVSNASRSVMSDIAVLTVVAPPTLAGVGFDGTKVSFTFNSVSNLVYTIEYKDALSDLAWNRLKTLTGDGGTVTIIEPPTNGTSRFYRLRID